MQIDLSPISLRALLSCRTTVGGCGLPCSFSHSFYPVTSITSRILDWKAAPSPLNPYLKENIIDFLRKELKPKELQLFPEGLVFDGEREILERTVVRQWMEQWLRWFSWYHITALSEEVTISQLMEVPMCSKSWRRTNEDQNLIKFGLIWKYYDVGEGWDISTTPRWLLCPYPNSSGDNEGDVMMAPVN
ncbi:hypothetical protein KY285_000721 [Solanum tuberosum]|nr:hypothetical protein KY285_000721 [Solanum tuberosum]